MPAGGAYVPIGEKDALLLSLPIGEKAPVMPAGGAYVPIGEKDALLFRGELDACPNGENEPPNREDDGGGESLKNGTNVAVAVSSSWGGDGSNRMRLPTEAGNDSMIVLAWSMDGVVHESTSRYLLGQNKRG